MSSFQKVLKKSKSFPNKPGIYWFSKKGSSPHSIFECGDKKIYIGKAASLKKRIASYFRVHPHTQILSVGARDPRISAMVSEADNISFKKTNSVLEAVILEANAIKKYLPKYNVKEKDNRSFVYLVISESAYPKIFIARGREVEKYLPPHSNFECGSEAKNYVFGPYQSYRILKTALNLARKIFPFGNCRPNQGKPCFDYQIGLCPGICIGAISKNEYEKNIKNLILFFKGEHKRLIKKLKKENPEKFFALQHVNDVAIISSSKFRIPSSKFTALDRIEGYDISHLSGSEPVGAMTVFANGIADKSQYRLFKIKNLKNKFDDLAMLSEILERRFNHKEWRWPDIIVIDGGKNQVAAAKKILAKFNIIIPIVGIAKILGHSSRAAEGDKLIFENIKPSVKKLLLTSRQIFQQVRNEAHRFVVSFQRKRRRYHQPKTQF